jgi:hypothetical protein
MKYRIDDWVIYKPFFDSEYKVLNSVEKKAVVLHVFSKNELYDYEIFIDGEGKIKKVLERYLFPVATPTY